MERREFMKLSAMAGGALLLPSFASRAYGAFAQSPALQKFVAPLRQFGVDIPIARKVDDAVKQHFPCDYYEIAMRQFSDKLHPDLPPTPLWGYGNAADSVGSFRHLGGAILAQKGKPVRIKWTNELPAIHILPVDTTVIDPYVGNVFGHDRAVPHLHGGLIPWPSDGGPFHWFDSKGNRGSSVVDWLPDGSGMTDDYWYPNTQSARFMWYHDHAIGLTRLNAYAGLATGYILQDDVEAELMATLGVGNRQIPVVFQDKVFQPNGGLWYPDQYDVQFFALAPGGEQLPAISLVPEFWGDTVLANGTAYPYVDVEPKVYRLRLLNACNTRVLSLKLVYAAGKKFPDSAEPDLANPGPVMQVIATEAGFLDGSVSPQGALFASDRRSPPLVLAPAERVDVLIDFSKVKPGQFLILHNDAPVPFPGGTPLADFHPDNNRLPLPPSPGFSPNTRTLLQFRVGGGTPETAPVAWTLPPSPAPAPTVEGVRQIALWETTDDYGRLAQNIGSLTEALSYAEDPPTEIVRANSVETWQVFNLTADTHPIHFHYVNVRVLARQAFNMVGGNPNFVGKPTPPGPDEQGWKETVRMHPGECITLLVDIPSTRGLAPEGVTIPNSPRLEDSEESEDSGHDSIAGHEYVWHCHILEHEEHDMMRPLIVVPDRDDE